jgi:CelD/BcsL family acetyltransferase involved in cellulose biosynthesis
LKGNSLPDDLQIVKEDFSSLTDLYLTPNSKLNWNLVFTVPAWLKVWWQHLGAGAELYIRSVKDRGEIIGLAPMQTRDHAASIIGSVDVCDYQDFIVVPGREIDFFQAVLNDLKNNHITKLHLETIRPDSTVVTHLIPLVKEYHFQIDYHQTDVSADLDLPENWETYLGNLDGKQRHELRRKMRNLQDVGQTRFYVVEDKNAIPAAVDQFLGLFPESRRDKAQFMTPEMQNFFRSLAISLGETGIVRFGVLEMAAKPVAMVMYFDYNNNVYLYNSAYDPAYKMLSVGIISKANSIQDSIQKKKDKYDFLKGAERYKNYLGGKEIPLYSCEILLQS